MPSIKLRAGQSILVTAADPSLKPDQGLPGSQPRPDQGLPGDQPHPDQGLPDLGFGPVDPSYGIDIGAHPDQGLPGSQPHPDQGLPGSQPHPDNTLPPAPDNALPPIPGDIAPGWEKKVAWTPVTGWVVVAVPSGDHATPSSGSGGGSRRK